MSSEESEVGMCATCGSIASQKCGNCRQVFYCKRDCQKLDWKDGHKEQCRPIQVKENFQLGRYLVATRDIKVGDVIFKDNPLVVGPQQYTIPICLTCYEPVDGSYRCKMCNWPMCSEKCEIGPDHQPECIIGQEIGSPIDIQNFNETNHFYELVTPLRSLTLKKRSPKKYEQLLNLESHCEERRGSQLYQDNQTRIVNMLRNYFLLHQFVTEELESSDENIHRITGILDTNAIEIQLPNSQIQGLYPTFSMMEHSCTPNIKYSFNDKRQVIVKAASDIKKDDHLCYTYTHILWGTLARREHLKSNKFFMCTCKRCSDATELGTNFCTLKCQNCPLGYLTSAAPLDELADWICSNCNNTITADRAKTVTLDLGAEIEEALTNPTIESLEKLIDHLSASFVHTNHFHLFAVRHTLLQMYGKNTAIDENSIKMKEKLCQDFLKLCTLLDPGMTKLAHYVSVVLYELHLAILLRARQVKCDGPSIRKDIEHAKTLLKKCISIMEEGTKDEQLSTLVKQNLLELEAWETRS